MPEQSQPLDCWAIVEVMGHKQFAGHVTEQLFGSAALIRVDVPATEQPARYGREARTTAEYSKLIGVASIYCITPCTEQVARLAAVQIEQDNDPIPVALPVTRQIPASVGAVVDAQLDEFVSSLDDDDDDGDVDAQFEPERFR
jgi:hypothetical protein